MPSFAEGCEALRALAQDEVAPDVARLSDGRDAASRSPWAARPAACCATRRGEPLPARRGWEGEPARSASRRRAPRRAGARAAARALARRGLGAAHRFDGPHLRDELLDRGVLVETLETATTWDRLEALHARGRARRWRRAGRDAAARRLPRLAPLSGRRVALLHRARRARTATTRRGSGARAKRAASDAIVAAGATITHHHAVGRDHAPWLAAEEGALGLAVLRAVKAELRPRRDHEPREAAA